MTEIDLKDRLTASVADIDAPAELLDRARAGGSRRLRRRRFTALATGALAVALVGGIAVTGQAILADTQPEVAAASAAGDPYGFLLKLPTRGDLAGDQAYLDQVVAAWQGSHDKSGNKSRGIFDDLRGTPQVAWAGSTPAGRAAIVVQQAYLHHHEDIQLDREGLYTLIGFVGPGADGKPKVVADSYPAPGVGLATGFVVGDGRKALIVLDTGQQVGWSKERLYTADGHSGRQYTPLKFTDGASVVSLPDGAERPQHPRHPEPGRRERRGQPALVRLRFDALGNDPWRRRTRQDSRGHAPERPGHRPRSSGLLDRLLALDRVRQDRERIRAVPR
jgi:hypothetical protein